MPFRFRRSVRIAPGLQLNLGRRGVSASVGERGAHLTVGHGPPGRGIGSVIREATPAAAAGPAGGVGEGAQCRHVVHHHDTLAQTQHSCHRTQSSCQIHGIAWLQCHLGVLISPQPVGLCLAGTAPGSLVHHNRRAAACPS